MGVNCGICYKNVSSELNIGMTKMELSKEDLNRKRKYEIEWGAKLTVSYLTEKEKKQVYRKKKTSLN